MFALVQKYREYLARRIAARYLFSIKKRADVFEETARVRRFPARSLGYYLQYAARQHDTGLFKRLLRTDDNGVVWWFNRLPLTRVTLGVHGLEIRHAPSRESDGGPHHLFVAPRSEVPLDTAASDTRRPDMAS